MEASIFQYDQAAHERALHDDGYDEGMQQGEAIRKEQAARIAELEAILSERSDKIKDASIFQYDQAAHERALHADGYDEGLKAGMKQSEAIRKEQAARIAELEARLGIASGKKGLMGFFSRFRRK